jgi:hypothetical protein
MSDPFDALKERRAITIGLDPIEAGAMFFSPLDEEQERQLEKWNKACAAIAQSQAGRPPTKDELAQLPVSRKMSAPRWHDGGDNPIDDWDEKISVWQGLYAGVRVPGHPRYDDYWYDRGCWVHKFARNQDWSKPCLYRRLK